MQMVPGPYSKVGQISFDESSRRYQTLLHATELAALCSFPELLREVSKSVHELFPFDFLNYALYSNSKKAMYLHMLGDAHLVEQSIELPVDDTPTGWVWRNQERLTLTDEEIEARFPRVLDVYKPKGVRSLVVLPMTTARARLGSLGFATTQDVNYDEDTIGFLSRITGLVALAVENSLTKDALARESEKLEALAEINAKLAALNERTHDELQKERDRLATLVEVNAALVGGELDLEQMLPAVANCISKSIPHDVAVVNLWHEAERTFETHSLEPDRVPGFPLKGCKTAADAVFTTEVLKRADGAIVDRAEMEAQSLKHPMVKEAVDAGLVCWCLVPMRSSGRLVGVLYLGSRKEGAFTKRHLELLKQIAIVSALFFENALAHRTLEQEKGRLQTMLEISRALVSSLDPKKLFAEISNCIRHLVEQDYAHLALYEEDGGVMRIHGLDFPGGHGLIAAETVVQVSDSPAGLAFRESRMKSFNHGELEQIGSEFTRNLLTEGIRSMYCFPLISRGRALGTLGIASKTDNAFATNEIEMLTQIAPQVAIAVDNSRAYGQIATLKDKLAKEKVYLEQEIRDALNFEEIVGQSAILSRVLDQVKTVAPSSATVLVTGETGTGKELIARAIHRLSPRHDGNFVKLNCAAIPTGLLESELFGHEKGAFTGAISQKIGRLELADKGTLFLDEVGEIPLELQPKLLRVLQDHEFERLGSTRTIRVNVRLVAATNRELASAVTKREFRSDLYYRLHVFPVRMPALRERPGDIPLLVQYFVHKFARRMNKQIDTIPSEAMMALESWSWPGNIRELENFVERSVILSEGTVLRVPLAELRPLEAESGFRKGTLEELEREYILQVLRQVGGVIAGSNGAAAKLGMKRTTLQSKMQRLGIEREEYGS